MNGILVVDKPAGRTSFDVVSEVKRILGVRKAGHTGTLDPLATGVLPVCLNEATKLARFFSLDSKEYRAVMLLGIRTDTLDTEGDVISRETPSVAPGEIEKALLTLVGKGEQRPPRYSAVKFQGKPLYQWARKGIVIEALPRAVEIHSLAVEEVQSPYVTFTVSCSKGTYIRTICSDVGDILGCGACLAGLRRTRSGAFREADALQLEGMDRETIPGHILSMADVLPEIVCIDVDPLLAERLKAGYQPLVADALGMNHIPSLAAGDMVKLVTSDRRLIAVAKMVYAFDQLPALEGKERALRIMRVFDD
jgi:tRNA pseudouridine55 synthase